MSRGHIRRAVEALALSTGVAGLAYRRRSLTTSGAAGAVGVGSLTYLAGGPRWSALLLAFFASSSALSRLESRSTGGKAIAAMGERGARRDLVQALANGGVATLAAAAYTLRQREPFAAAFAGALAAATADTWATEIGSLSPTPPRRILTGEPVPTGTSGGITPTGLSGAVAGGTVIGLLAGAVQHKRPSVQHGVIVAMAGYTGSLLDSVAGATIQAAYRCPRCDKPTERRVHGCGTEAQLVHGYAWCTNDAVNVICTGAGALLAATLTILDAVSRPAPLM